MPRRTKPLSATQIKNAKPGEKPCTLFDGGSLFLEVVSVGLVNLISAPRNAKVQKCPFSKNLTEATHLKSVLKNGCVLALVSVKSLFSMGHLQKILMNGHSFPNCARVMAKMIAKWMVLNKKS